MCVGKSCQICERYRDQNSFPAWQYWRLVNPNSINDQPIEEYLRRNGIDTTRMHKKRGLLMAAFLRAQQGIIDYHACEITELQAFCEARKLPLSTSETKTMSRAQLIEMLDEADTARTFDRFMNLPPELRVMICEQHFAHICERTSKDEPVPGFFLCDQIESKLLPEPPLSKVCSLIRQESLPHWYRDTTFHISIDRQWSSTPHTSQSFVPHLEFAETEKVLKTASKQALQRISKLHITGSIGVWEDGKALVCDYYVALKQKGAIETKVGARWDGKHSTGARKLLETPEGKDLQRSVQDIMVKRLEDFVAENVSSVNGLPARDVGPFGKLFAEVSRR